MKKFLLFVAMTLFAISVSAKPVQLIPADQFDDDDIVELSVAPWSSGLCFKPGSGLESADLTAYDYVWIVYDPESLEDSGLRFTIGYDEYTGYAWGQESFAGEGVALDEKQPILGIRINKTDKITSKSSGDPDHEKIASDFAGDLFAQHVTQIDLWNTSADENYIAIKGIYLGTEAEFKGAKRKAGMPVYVWVNPKNVLEGKDMASYIRVQIGPDGAVAKDQPANGGVEDGVATINVRSKEDALSDNPTFSQWYGSWKADDPSTETAENVAPWDTQAYIKFPKKFNANDKISVSMDVRADKAISGVPVGCHDIPGQYQSGFANVPALNIGTTWSTYEIPERLISEVGCDAANFGSIAFDLSQLIEKNTIYFKNVKVMISHPTLDPGPDHLSVKDMEIRKSEINLLPISMNNEDEITAFQFDVEVPQNITLSDVQLGTRKSDSHTVGFTKQSDRIYRVVGVSLESALFSGNEGKLVNLVLTADRSIKKGKYNLDIKDIVLTSPSGEKHYPYDIKSVLTVSEPTTGDVDGDGYIDVADIVAMVNYIIGNLSSGFIPLAADINGDGEINVFDVMMCINLVLNQNSRMEDSARAAEVANDVAEDKITINDFNISAGETKDMSISLENTTEYVLFQFDLYLPEGITIESYSADLGRLPKSTTISMAQQEDGSYRFISYNMEKRSIVGNSGGIITLRVKASNDFTNDAKTGYFRKVMLSKADATGPTYEEMAFPINGASNIESVKQEKSYDVYDLLGRKVNLPTKGVYILNGKKVIIK